MRGQGSYFLLAFLLSIFFYISPSLLSIDGYVFADDIAVSQIPDASSDTLQQEVEKKKEDKIITYITLGLLVAIIAGMFGFMWSLQRKFYKGCRDEKQMSLFAQSPAGLPVGTIRSMIAFSIVILSLYFIALQVLGIGGDKPFPEALASLLGAVIGFYFGSRSGGSSDSGLQMQVDGLKKERDKVMSEKEGDETQALLNKVKKGVSLTKKVLKFLPAEKRKKYEELVGKLEQGIGVVQGLGKIGQISDAVSKAKDTFTVFVKENPVQDLVKKAADSFKLALGISLPQVALVTAVVGVGAGLAGLAYQKWKARILQAPFSPAELPLKVVDANTGFSLLVASPIFKQAFMQQLQDNDRPFMESIVNVCIKESDTNSIYSTYKDFFESREQFEQGLSQFRHTAADRELTELIDNESLAEFGGYTNFIEMIDKIHEDENALADLDTLVVVSENLQNEGEPVVEVFKKASEGLEK